MLFIFFFISTVNCFNNILSRKDVLYLASSTNILNQINNDNQYPTFLSPTFNNNKENKNDPYAKWSLYGFVPPHIEKAINYEELLEMINNNQVFSVQKMIQGNQLLVTTKENHRLSCSIEDDKLKDLQILAINKNGKKNFNILPVDPLRSRIREISKFSLLYIIIYYILAELNIIDVDTTPYSSIKERNDYINSRKKPKRVIGYLKEKIKIMNKLKNKNKKKNDFN